jgi:hypothetical protein
LRIKVILWLAMAAGVCLLCACGSSSTATGSAAGAAQGQVESAALAGYIARGDEVCRQGDQAIAPINARGAEIERRHGTGPGVAAKLAPVLRRTVREYRSFYKRLKRIQPPPANAAAVAAIIMGLGRVGGDLERLAGAVARGELARVTTISQERDIDHARVSALELELGFKVCGQPPAQPALPG